LAAGNNNTVKTLLCDVILPHISAKIKEHIENECMRRNIQLVYKQFNGSFGQSLPDLINANDYKKRIKQQKERQREDEA
jgi:hypothetical protein